MHGTRLRWLGGRPPVTCGVTWGCPWERGVLNRSDGLQVFGESGNAVAVQSWPTAYWPDGSVKWTAHAAVFDDKAESSYEIVKTEANVQPDGRNAVHIVENERTVTVTTGDMVCELNRHGPELIAKMVIGGRQICSGVLLLCTLERRVQNGNECTTSTQEFLSQTSSLTIEQDGPFRAVVKLQGWHERTGCKVIPFTVRLYFYANVHSVKMTHSIHYDGISEPEIFVKGLGVSSKATLSGPMYNRFVRFVGDDGVFTESPQLLLSRAFRANNRMYESQIEGSLTEPIDERDKRIVAVSEKHALWQEYKILQDSADHYMVQERTSDGCSWVVAGHGRRAAGLTYVGSEQGGMAVGMTDFWEKHPRSVQVKGLGSNQAEIRTWFWSPDARAMDLRHYDTQTHLDSAYEGFDEMRSTPVGIGNTNQLVFAAYSTPPNFTTIA